ncbi:phosphoglycerate mutase-like protein [Trichoderma citrinoviride]|uniref:Phosphoglycerate mutase-like protein n=1 Tax=Trichoderma citrinoviride TaxID=58853 RepID=A0A2T4B550_9HYPO|nr:phosphoglycerate mutase-like protein [Trichoderma citrinoviride]PTB64466.1 phosphoglycerate mutase-like protein [Trichoderma citrinoviride]
MLPKLLLASLSAASAASAEQVLGVYVFHRHGDRTAKAWAPVNLTALGADQVASSAAFYRSRYVDSDSSSSNADTRIAGISPDAAVLSQLAITAPVDNVLQNSAAVFAQGLYPPSRAAGSQRLRNGTTVEAPLGGYQYIPVNAVASSASSAGSESSAWLQGSSGCGNAVVSSNSYFLTPEYLATLNQTHDFYQGLLPVINTTFNSSTATYKNGYTIFDYINVANIHNTSIPSSNLLTNSTLTNLYDLASTHEWNLAYNASEPARAIAGSVLAGQILTALQAIVDKPSSAPKFNVQFGAYAAFMAFFGLAQLPAASSDFYGICDYASSMALELVAPSADRTSADDLSVRFLWSNGTAAAHGLKAYPLFGQNETSISWNDFKAGIGKFAVADTKDWCTVCGNTDGSCAANSTDASSPSSQSSDDGSKGGNGISRAVAGVIGAMVTLGVILGLEALVLLLGGLRVVKKSTLAGAAGAGGAGETAAKA